VNDRPIRVLWVMKEFGWGGAERLLLEVLPFMRGVAVRPVATAARPIDLLEPLRSRGLEPVVLGARSTLDPSWLPRFARLIRRARPDLVHFQAPIPAALGRPVAKILRRPVVHSEQGMWSLYRPMTRVANGLTYGMNDAAIAVSDAVYDSIVRHRLGRRSARRIVTIPNGVDVDGVLQDAGARRLTPLAPMTFGMVGHLKPEKGPDVFVRAAALVQREFPAAAAVLVGGGYQRDEIERLAARSGADVRLLGVRDDARVLTASLDVFVMPSRSEGLPVALLEAMALGRPIVATRAGGIPEVVRDGLTGLLVPADDPPALARAIVRLLSDRDLSARLGAAAADAAKRDWSAAATAERITDVYRHVLRR
jgi:glycosyltransferase involved in cell wall biosynthesis